MNLFEIIQDAYYIGIKGLHKHDYQECTDRLSAQIPWERFKCTTCGKIVNLDYWQIQDLPPTMKYEKREGIADLVEEREGVLFLKRGIDK